MATRRRRRVRQNKEHIGLFYVGDGFDYVLLFLVLFMVCFGLVMVYSSSSYKGYVEYKDASYFFMKQLKFAVAGLGMMIIVSFVDYRLYRRFANFIYIAIVGATIAVLVIGKASHGATRWIQIGPIQFQPSEVAKLGLCIYVAAYSVNFSKLLKKNGIGNVLKSHIMFVLPTIIPIGLIASENLSTAIICLAIVVGILFVLSPKKIIFAALAGFGAVGIWAFLQLSKSYRMERIVIWQNIETHEKGYQTRQAMYAIGSGGLTGKGLGSSIQKMGFVPEAHNDMIFSIIVEELGMFGAVCLILLFVLMIWRFMLICTKSEDLFGALIVVGVLTHIAAQVWINIAVVTNIIPPTGVTLPFISYGGTSLIMLMIEMGVVLSVSRHTIEVGEN